MIEKFLNNKNSLRSIPDDEFERILPQLAKELKSVSIETKYSDDVLLRDYDNLKKWNPTDILNARSRIGMKLCDHFFPNIYDVKSNGKVFRDCWEDEELLMKILRWNRGTHSTPYLSELKRGVYFCGGLTKSTMFRPQLAKMIVSKYDSNTVLDPCAGWGGRMIGTTSCGFRYIGLEPNTETYNSLVAMSEFLKIESLVTLINDGVENIKNYDIPNVDLILTSPPYYDLEIYSEERTQSHIGYDSYDDWVSGFLHPAIRSCVEKLNTGGISCWNVHNIGKMKMISDVSSFHESLGFMEDCTFKLGYPNRPRLKINGVDFHKVKTSGDLTIAYGKRKS